MLSMRVGVAGGVVLATLGVVTALCACARPVYYLQAPLERPKVDAGGVTGASDAGSRRDSSAPSGRVPGSMAGRWIGTGVQSDGQRWQLVVTFKSTVTGVCATAEYPGVGCSAEWTCYGLEEGGHIRATERLTRGKDKCIDGGEMLMDFQGDELEWSWRKDGQSAEATLRKGP